MRSSFLSPLPVLVFVNLWSGLPAQARDLTFDERVKAQEAIERVYYSHQIGATKPFEDTVSREVLEKIVRTYLKQTVALDKFWHTSVTAEMLHREWERMARGSQMPDRLRELLAALGNDQELVEECLARSALVDRLARSFFAFDEGIHASERMEADRLHVELTSGHIDPSSVYPRREVLDLGPEEEAKWAERFPVRPGEIGPVVEEREAYRVGVVLGRPSGRLRVASYVVRKRGWDDWWRRVGADLDATTVKSVASGSAPTPLALLTTGSDTAVAACVPGGTWNNGSLDDMPDARVGHTAVWTGSFVLVWGGHRPNGQAKTLYLQDGHRYDPATDTWSSLSETNAPAGRASHTAVWTGSEMVVWGGYGSDFGPDRVLYTGGRYDPVADAWYPVSVIGAPAGRAEHTAVWTGSEMVVWGGGPSLNTGGRYDPVADRWRPTTTLSAPSGRTGHTAVWTGSEMIVYGGRNTIPELADGGSYDPRADSWSPVGSLDAGRALHTAVWTGSRMIVWGGIRGNYYQDNGGLYDPSTNIWTPMSTVNAPTARIWHTAVWTGTRMIVWGGYAGYWPGPTHDVNTGGVYDPVTDTWSTTSTRSAPSARTAHVAVWTGNLMVVWGGYLAQALYLNSGGRYDPITDTWTPVSQSFPEARTNHTAIWTGRDMIVWGGVTENYVATGSGLRYDPVTDTWSPTSETNAPAPRSYHTAVWTGTEMVVWGGYGGSLLSSGGRYDPVTDTWSPTSETNAPAPRSYHTAVWTGTRMIVWGGSGPGGSLNTGGVYDPAADAWSATSTTDAPSSRYGPTAVWTGSRMIIWSGETSTGGQYDPSTDTWTPTSTFNAPYLGQGHAAVWTGREMIVWGGSEFGQGGAFNIGGRYDPETDTWRPTSTVGAPGGRAFPGTVWTGHEMIVWGGWDCPYDLGCQVYDTGGRYDPAADVWATMSNANAPIGRGNHTAVWTGSHMVIWGGDSLTAGPLNTGGRYDPGRWVDDDGDGISVCSGDCDDRNAAVHPGATEVCDGLDNNCDEHVDEGFDLGNACTADVDACHQLIGTKVCRSDGTGTECSGSLVFHDTTPPEVSLSVTPAVLWPPNHRMVPVQVNWTVNDACDPSTQVVLISVISSEPDDGPEGGDGNTTGDIQDASIGTPDATVALRAERSGDGPGRVYTLTYMARDASGNTTSALGVVTVPTDLGQGPEPLLMNLEPDGTRGMVHVYWGAVDGAATYDLIGGDLAGVTLGRGVTWLGPVRTMATGLTGTSCSEDASAEMPALGHVIFYLIEWRDGGGLASGYGTESAPWPRQPTCDGGCSEALASGGGSSGAPARRP